MPVGGKAEFCPGQSAEVKHGPGARGGHPDTKESSSFVHKRTKKPLPLRRTAIRGDLSKAHLKQIKVFCFFFSKKKCCPDWPIRVLRPAHPAPYEALS
jgi:hypothetical protein